MRKIKWGILGPGVIANTFASDFQFVKNAELVAVASRSSERAKLFANTYQIPKVYGSYSELYADKDIDAIYVATPHNFHFDMCANALKAGKAVLCEKPITINTKELEELISIAEANNGYLVEGMWTYFLPSIQKAYSWFENKKIGNLMHVKADFGYRQPYDITSRLFNPDLAGGVLLDMGIYNIAMAWLFTKQIPTNLHVLAEIAETGVDCDVQALFDYGNVKANLHTSFMCKLNNWTYVIGDEGYIAIHDFWRSKECFLYKNEKLIEHFVDQSKGIGFNYEIEKVSNDLLNNKKQSSIMPHTNSLAFQNLMTMVLNKIHKK